MDSIDRSQVDRDYQKLVELLAEISGANSDRTTKMMDVRAIVNQNRTITKICKEIFADEIEKDPEPKPLGKALYLYFNLEDLVDAIKTRYGY